MCVWGLGGGGGGGGGGGAELYFNASMTSGPDHVIVRMQTGGPRDKPFIPSFGTVCIWFGNT